MDAQVLHVSLARQRERAGAPTALAHGGAGVMVGTRAEALHDILLATQSIVPAADTLFGPRGACVTGDGALWVCDTGHHRLLGWPSLPERDGEAARWLFGQPALDREGRNAHGPVSAQTLNVPTGICAIGEGLAIADAWNHRVLIWLRSPASAHRAPDVVLGQAGFDSGEINRGHDVPAADTLYWPYGVHFDGTNLWVADTGNRRVLRWDGVPSRNGQPADSVLGQPDFGHRDENAGEVAAGSLRWPHAMAHWNGGLVVADAGNNRVLFWRDAVPRDHAPCDVVIGQRDARIVDHNRGEYWPTASSLNMPYGAAVHRDRLLVGDTANSRILRFDSPDDIAASALAGQFSFADKGDNRWRPATRDSLCWPYNLSVHGDLCVIADSGNNRVLLWEIAS